MTGWDLLAFLSNCTSKTLDLPVLLSSEGTLTAAEDQEHGVFLMTDADTGYGEDG